MCKALIDNRQAAAEFIHTHTHTVSCHSVCDREHAKGQKSNYDHP